MHAPKEGLLIAQIGMKPKKGMKKEDDSDQEEAEASAGEDLAAAIKSGDGKEIAKAFAHMSAVCSESDYEEEEKE